MKILFYDILQESDAPSKLLTPSLADRAIYPDTVPITLPVPSPVNSIGIGYASPSDIIDYTNGYPNTDAFAESLDNKAPDFTAFEYVIDGNGAWGGGSDLEFDVIDASGGSDTTHHFIIPLNGNGLYTLPGPTLLAKKLILYPNGNYLGRIAAGLAIRLGTGRAKEPAFIHTAESRRTLSGQEIPGVGGYGYHRITLDVRYKIDSLAIEEIRKGYRTQIGRGIPLFIQFDDENTRIPFIPRLYAKDTNTTQLAFESSINKYLFSRKFIFEERF